MFLYRYNHFRKFGYFFAEFGYFWSDFGYSFVSPSGNLDVAAEDGAKCKEMVIARWCPRVTSHCDSHHKRIIVIILSLYNDNAT